MIMDITKAIDIIEKWEFFYGQRAGRELWADKPTNVQNQDIEDFNRDLKVFKQMVVDMQELYQYRQIGTLDECKTAREKQKPKKPITYKGTNREDCPVCGNTVRGIKKPFGDYCSKCGQAIDWGGSNG